MVAVWGYNVEVSAQTGDWSPVWQMPSEVATRAVTIVTDTTPYMYAFWAAAEPGDTGGAYTAQFHTILYTKSDDGSSWNKPIDIISDPKSFNSFTAISTGTDFHLFWNNDCIRHATVPIQNVDQPLLWMNSVRCIGPQAIYESVAATVDEQGSIYLVYSVEDALRIQVSSDGGNTWTESATPIAYAAQSSGASLMIFPKIVASSTGQLYVVWTGLASNAENNKNLGVFFAQSTDQGQSWSFPFQLADESNTQPSIAVINPDQVHVVWNTTVDISKRFHRWSVDGGDTWHPPDEVLSGLRGGVVGAPGLLADHNETLHVLVGTDSGVRYRSWLAGRWSEPEVLSQADEGESWVTGIVAVGDTRVCAYWATTPGFSIRCKGEMPPKKLITPVVQDGKISTILVQPTSQVSASLTETPTPTKTVSISSDTSTLIDPANSIERSNPTTPILIGIGAVLLLIICVITIHLLSRGRR